MLTGKKYISNSTFYTVFRRHYCPQCKTKLKCVRISKIVNSESKEAMSFDFGLGDIFLVGDVEFIWKEFQCEKCYMNYSIEEMKRIEKAKRTR